MSPEVYSYPGDGYYLITDIIDEVQKKALEDPDPPQVEIFKPPMEALSRILGETVDIKYRKGDNHAPKREKLARASWGYKASLGPLDDV